MIPDGIQPIFVIVVLLITLVIVYREIIRPSVSFLIATVIFLITGILDASTALAGFSNPSIASVILLILITAGLRNTYNIELFFDNVFRKTKSYRSFLFLMMSKVAVLSSFLNNTPIVALMTPYVVHWGRKHDISPSKLLIPLSYATIMGGMITIIGTSTTLVLNGFLQENLLSTLNPFHLLIIGSAVTVSGVLFLGFIGRSMLPDRKDLLQKFEQNQREYLVQSEVTRDSEIAGRSVMDADLRNLSGVYLVEIVRGEEVLYPVGPDELIQAGDQLIFAGEVNSIMELIQSKPGLILPESTPLPGEMAQITEVVIASNSSLIGKTVKGTDFRNRYDGAIVAIHRNGERMEGKIGDMKLSAGDSLVLFVGENFRDRAEVWKDLYIISDDREAPARNGRSLVPLAALSALAIGLLISGLFSLFTSLLIVFSVMLIFKMITIRTLKRDLDFEMIGIMVFSLAIGQAMIESGAGQLLASGFMSLFGTDSILSITIGLLLITAILTSFVTNIGAVSIVFPIAYSLSQSLELENTPFYLAIAFAASAAFLTPISYQTNLIIYGPGGYKFKDFFKIGLPTTLLYLGVVILCVFYLFGGR